MPVPCSIASGQNKTGEYEEGGNRQIAAAQECINRMRQGLCRPLERSTWASQVVEDYPEG